LTSAPLPKLVAPPESLLEKAQEKLAAKAEPSN
jgi:hypothetical protein